jgi:hypothetical protein
VAYLDNIKKFGLMAMATAIATLLVNTIVFMHDLHYMVARMIPPLMLLTIGFFAYTERNKGKADVVFSYLTFYGIGLFTSGVLLLLYYKFDMGAWEYLIVAPAGLVLTALGISVRNGKKISKLWWRVFAVSFVVLVLFAIHEIMRLLLDGHFMDMNWMGRVGREILLIANAYLLYFALYSEVKKDPKR